MYASMAEAVKETGATASFISVPPRCAADAIVEAAEAGIAFIVCITEGIPAQDEALAYNRLVGSSPPRACSAELPGHHLPGQVQHRHHVGRHRPAPAARSGSCSRSGTLTYQALHELSHRASGRRPASASAATPSRAPTSSTAWPPSRPTPRPGPS